MAKLKIRKPSLIRQDMMIGTSGSYTLLADDGSVSQVGDAAASLLKTSIGGGTALSNIMCGSVSLACSALGAGSTYAVTATIAGLTTGHKVFLGGVFGASPGLHVIAACATAANTLTACFFCSLSDVSASTLTANYLAVRDQ